MGFLDDAGVERLWQKMKAYVASKTGSNLTFDKVYPVGSIYMSVNNVNPGTLFGGTWIAWGGGRVPIGVDTSDTDFQTAEKIGGAKTVNLAHSHTVNSHSHTTSGHTLTVNEIPSHRHSVNITSGNGGAHSHVLVVKALLSSITHHHGEGAYPSAASSTAGSYVDAQTVAGAVNTAPNHTHSVSGNTGNLGGGNSHSHGDTGKSSPATDSKLSASQSIMQPYITCYMWKRTA